MDFFNKIKSYNKHFGSGSVNSLPIRYFIEPKGVKNQGIDTDKCSFYAIASCFEAISEYVLEPDWTYKLAKEVNNGVGFHLDWACIFACETGFMNINGNIFRSDTLYVFNADGKYDLFDNIKLCLYSTSKPVVCSAFWKPEWTFAANGMIQPSSNKGIEPHAFCVIGWDENHLIVQNSKGEKIGNKGLFYFTRDIVNKEFIDAFCFSEFIEEKNSIFNMFKKIVSSLLKCYNVKHERSNS